MLWEVDSTAIFGRLTHICRKSGRYGRKPRIYSRNWYTAKSGGGSFKKRKPTGEIRCCEPGVVKRIQWWTERYWRSPLFLLLIFLSLTIKLPTFLSSMYLSICVLIYLSLSFIYLPVYLSVCLSIYLSFYLALSFYLYHYLCLSVSLFLSSVYLSSCRHFYLSVYLFFCLFVA